MKQKIKVLLAEPAQEVQQQIAQAILQSYGLHLVGSTANAYELLSLAETYQPDVIIFDLSLEHLDGLQALKILQKMQIPAKYIATSCIFDADVVQQTQALGVDCFLVKPFSLEAILEKIYLITHKNVKQLQNKIKPTWDSKTDIWVTDALSSLGLQSHLKGYRYLRACIIYAAQNLDSLSRITTEIYPAISFEFSSSSGRVERAMRHAISKAWEEPNLEACQHYLPLPFSCGRKKPNNGELISILADRLRIQKKVWEEEEFRNAKQSKCLKVSALCSIS